MKLWKGLPIVASTQGRRSLQNQTVSSTPPNGIQTVRILEAAESGGLLERLRFWVSCLAEGVGLGFRLSSDL